MTDASLSLPSGSFTPRVLSADEVVRERGEALFFDACLYPHNALSPRGFAILMAVIGGMAAVLGLLFLSLGAWPVFGFLGVDILLVWLAFRTAYRRSKMWEAVRLERGRLVVERHWPGRPARLWELEPAWLKARVDRPYAHDSKIVLSSHGKALAIGHFLSPAEKLAFVEALNIALDRWRRPDVEADVACESQ